MRTQFLNLPASSGLLTISLTLSISLLSLIISLNFIPQSPYLSLEISLLLSLLFNRAAPSHAMHSYTVGWECTTTWCVCIAVCVCVCAWSNCSIWLLWCPDELDGNKSNSSLPPLFSSSNLFPPPWWCCACTLCGSRVYKHSSVRVSAWVATLVWLCIFCAIELVTYCYDVVGWVYCCVRVVV